MPYSEALESALNAVSDMGKIIHVDFGKPVQLIPEPKKFYSELINMQLVGQIDVTAKMIAAISLVLAGSDNPEDVKPFYRAISYLAEGREIVMDIIESKLDVND